MEAPRTEILPPFLRNAGVFLWGFVLPQLVLLILNLRGWWLIAGELESRVQTNTWLVFASEILILALNLGLFVFFKRFDRTPGWRTGAILLPIHVLYLWFGGQTLASIVPTNVAPWIIGGFDFFTWNLTFFMPGAFLSLCLVACVPLGLSSKRDTFYTLGTLLVAPLAWYFLVSVLQPLLLLRFSEFFTILGILLLILLLLAALVRLFGYTIEQMHKKTDESYYMAVIALSLVMPLIGLHLNRQIPFPADFQVVDVYVLTVLNSLLLLPRPGRLYAGLRLFGRALSYPFIFYFFLVFLPFLPLAMFAIIAAGAGFLMITPVALGVFQTDLLLKDFHFVREASSRTRALLLLLAGLAVLPGYFVLDSLAERAGLNRAVDYFYATDTQTEPLSLAQAERAAHALLALRSRKKGVQWPYLSEFYNAIVFGNMALPDDKIERMYRLLTGSALLDIQRDRFRFSQRDGWARGGAVTVPERKSVRLISANMTQVAPGKASVRLLARNDAQTTHAEYQTRIELPEGVFVTGLKLKIGDDFVPGKLFDRKTAMWVYQKITEVRRDPALLVYHSPNALELRVYPFPAQGEREVELDFAFPSGAKADIYLDGRHIELNTSVGTPFQHAGDYLTLLGDSALPTFTRKPYLHFVLDYSLGKGNLAQEYSERIAAIAEKLGISDIRLTVANLRDTDLNNGELLDATDSEKIRKLLAAPGIPRAYGFWAERVIRKKILAHAESVAQGNFQRVPVFVLISASSLDRQEFAALPFQFLAFVSPDVDAWYLDQSGKLARYSLTGEQMEILSPQLAPLHVFKRGARVALLGKQATLAVLPGNGPLEYFDGQAFQPMPEQDVANPGLEWEKRAELWRQWREATLEPAQMEQRRASLLEAARAQDTLIPSAAFIVVESTDQSKILERKEAESLANRDALAFEEKKTPEPSAWLMFALVLGLIFWSRRRKHSPSVHSEDM